MYARVKATGQIIEVERISRGVYGRVDVAELYKRASLDFNVNQSPVKKK